MDPSVLMIYRLSEELSLDGPWKKKNVYLSSSGLCNSEHQW